MNWKLSVSFACISLVLISDLAAFEITANHFFDFDRFKHEFRKSYATPREELRR